MFRIGGCLGEDPEHVQDRGPLLLRQHDVDLAHVPLLQEDDLVQGDSDPSLAADSRSLRLFIRLSRLPAFGPRPWLVYCAPARLSRATVSIFGAAGREESGVVLQRMNASSSLRLFIRLARLPAFGPRPWLV